MFRSPVSNHALALLADVQDAMPALPWPYVIAVVGSLGGAIVLMWRRDVAREEAARNIAQEHAEKLETLVTQNAARVAENTEALRHVVEFLKR